MDGKLQRVASTTAAPLLAHPVRVVVDREDVHDTHYVIHSGEQLRCVSWNGDEQWALPLQGNVASAISAADIDNDGRAELVAATPDKRLRVLSADENGTLQQQHDFQHLIGWHCHHPVMFDLAGDGRLCLLAAGSDDQGQLIIRAHLPDGSTLWESPLNVAVEHLRAVILNAGNFLAKDHAGVAVSMTDARLVHEGTFMLDGQNGEVLWFKGLHRDGDITMPYRPNGIPIAYDLDRDGVEEIGMDMLSYMAFLQAIDGEFAMLRPTSNIRTEGAVFGGKLYNTYCPLWKQASDPKPHWFVTAGFGPFGLMHPDPSSGVWREDLDYDVPMNVALVDVDGDGALEAGYSARNDTKFVCRDVWTGNVEWTLELPAPAYGATITADFDGNGRGEFFCGRYCIGVNDEGAGEVRWQSPVHITWPVIADFDGDGDGEIAGGVAGRIVVLNAAQDANKQ
ncbi:MAG: FG-GAP repeat domain-containing protein [Bythopirellula sp.]